MLVEKHLNSFFLLMFYVNSFLSVYNKVETSVLFEAVSLFGSESIRLVQLHVKDNSAHSNKTMQAKCLQGGLDQFNQDQRE